MKNTSMFKSERGAVSLFVVIFAILIITVVTISFLRLVVSDQEQSTNANLAESARNSALAGVEDAKRALVDYMAACNEDTGTTAACDAAVASLTSNVCNDAVAGIVGSSVTPEEVVVQQSESTDDTLLEQAYTCVKVTLDTEDYLGTGVASSVQMVPLVVDEGETFDRVTVEWFSRDDLSSSDASSSLTLQTSSNKKMLSAWPSNTPSLLEVQLMQFGDSFTMDSFDTTVDASGTTQSNANTVFLYPTSDGATSRKFTAIDTRKSNAGDESPADTSSFSPQAVRCASNLSAGGYACKMILELPEPIGGGDRTAYLRLVPFYNSTHFRVTMQDGSAANTVKFNAVQPEVDSTGRANNVFKRVASRVDLYNTGLPYPTAAVDLTNNLCKDFAVTDEEYLPGSCTP